MSDFNRWKRTGGRSDTVDATEVIDLGLSAAEARRLRLLSHILYGLYAAAWFTGGVSGIIGVIIDYVKRADAGTTIYATHARWRIRTFWWSLFWTLVSAPFLLIHIGFFFFFIIWIWGAYRIIKGWLRLIDLKAVG